MLHATVFRRIYVALIFVIKSTLYTVELPLQIIFTINTLGDFTGDAIKYAFKLITFINYLSDELQKSLFRLLQRPLTSPHSVKFEIQKIFHISNSEKHLSLQ